MIKKTMLAACVGALALAALPALAAAASGDPYLKDGETKIENTTFTVSGGAGELNTPEVAVECASVTGHGEFINEETGKIQLTFHGCHSIFEIPCTTEGSPEGTITTTELPFHLKTVVHEGEEKPGVLITGDEENTIEDEEHGSTPHFASFECSFLANVVVAGNGIVGTITSPGENTPSNTASLSFTETSPQSGLQTHKKVAGSATEYELHASTNGGATEQAGEEAEGEIEFAGGMEPEIKTTP